MNDENATVYSTSTWAFLAAINLNEIKDWFYGHLVRTSVTLIQHDDTWVGYLVFQISITL